MVLRLYLFPIRDSVGSFDKEVNLQQHRAKCDSVAPALLLLPNLTCNVPCYFATFPETSSQHCQMSELDR